MLEANIAEENRVRAQSRSNSSVKPGDRKRKWEQMDEGGKSSGFRKECTKCGKRHGGECWKIAGVCARCGSKDHAIQNCPRMGQGRETPSEDTKSCYHCGKSGHFKRECPKLQVERQMGNRGDKGQPAQN